MEKNQETKQMARRSSGEVARPEQIRQGPRVLPDVDILEKGDEILLHADMPGVSSDDLDVRYENGVLSLYGKTDRQERAGADLLVQEFEPADYYREFMVGEGIDQSKVTAECDNGVLTLHLPKSEAVKARKIEIRKATK